MAKSTTQVLTSGIDWVTCTGKPDQAGPSLIALGRACVDAEVTRGNERRALSVQGYTGYAAGSAAYGERDDGVLLRVSAHVADAWGASAVQLADHVSRIDLQATYLIDPADVRNHILRARRAVARFRREGKRVTVTLHHTLPHGTTLEIGKRTSDQMGRVYDKFSESKGRYRPGSVRAEVEFKGGLAERYQTHLRREGMDRFECLLHTHRWFYARGVDLGLSADRGRPLGVQSPPPSDFEELLQWWSGAVAPGIRRWLDPERRAAICRALGLIDEPT